MSTHQGFKGTWVAVLSARDEDGIVDCPAGGPTQDSTVEVTAASPHIHDVARYGPFQTRVQTDTE
ncbi:MAG: hypothetical protein M3Y77_16795 [Actinomycetota bacterium]|nr:hypothetical protein [Actinomycetota bacterium]